jgi:hypothetical protein
MPTAMVPPPEPEPSPLIVVKHSKVERAELNEQKRLGELWDGLQNDTFELRRRAAYFSHHSSRLLPIAWMGDKPSRLTEADIEHQRSCLKNYEDRLLKLEEEKERKRSKSFYRTTYDGCVNKDFSVTKKRTYEVVKAELDSVDLDDTEKVNKLLAELKGLEKTRPSSPSRPLLRSLLASYLLTLICLFGIVFFVESIHPF